jgi:hypothetical protein
MSNDTRPLDKLSNLRPAAHDPLTSCPSVVAHEEDLPRTIGKYEVLGRLGVGAMGVVYKCRQPDLDRPVAVKVLLAARHAAGQVLRFRREAWAAARLQHPNVVQIYDVGNDGELPFLVMEYVEGCSLDRLIGTPILTLETTLRLVYQVARALQAAHDQGIIHRDIKPSNILIHTSGHPKLADFGLAKSLHDCQALSGSGDMIGTPRYMSPEQVLAAPDEVDARTDVYSLGAVMYEMLTGRPPVDGPNVLAVLSALTDQEPVPPRQLNAAVPEEVDALCRWALAKDPRHRLSSAGQLADTIQSYLLARLLRQPEPRDAAALSEWFTLPLAVPPPRPGRGRRWGRGRLLAVLAAVVCGLATVFVLVGPPAGPTDADLAQIRADLIARAAAPSEDPPRERANELLAALTAFLDRAPDDAEIRLLHARTERRVGECQAALEDAAAILRTEPGNLAARAEHLLAAYQLHVLYWGNLHERLLRPRRLDLLRPDVQALRESGDPEQRRLGELAEALARQDHDEAGRMAEAWSPDGHRADEWMLVADALGHAAARAYDEETAADESTKPVKKRRREALAARAAEALGRGLEADPAHAGLLFVAADSFQRGADWEVKPNEDRAAVLLRRRAAFESAYQRLQQATLRGSGDTAVARAILLTNYGQDEAARDRIEGAVSCPRPLLYAFTLQAWLRLWDHPEGTLTTEKAQRLLEQLRPAFGGPEDFNSYLVRALLRTAAGCWSEAREDLRWCRRLLGADDLPASDRPYGDWLARANASTAEYLDATLGLLSQLPVAPETRRRLAEEVLGRVEDAALVEQDGLRRERANEIKAWACYHLARALSADTNNRGRVLAHIRRVLELRVSNLNASSFRDDGVFSVWNEDEEFKALYGRFAQP